MHFPLLISSTAIAITSFFLAALIPLLGRKPLHIVWSIFNISVGLWSVALLALALNQNNRDGAILWVKMLNTFGMVIAPLFLHFVYLLSGRNQIKVIAFSYLIFALAAICTATNVFDLNPTFVYDSFFYTRSGHWLYHIEILLWNGMILYGLYQLYKAVLLATSDSRHQLRFLFFWILAGFAAGGITHWAIVFGYKPNPYLYLIVAIHSCMVTYGIFKHKVLGLDIAVKRGLIYSASVAISLSLYFIIVSLFEQVFQRSIGYKSSYSIFLIAVLIFIAEPIRNKVQHIIDYAFFKGTLERLSEEKALYQTRLIKHDHLKAVATLAAGMAHEIRNPLTSIRAFAEHLPLKYDRPEFRENFSRLVIDEVDRINSIVQQLLDFSKTNELQIERIALAPLIQDTLELLSSNLVKNKIEARIDVDPILVVQGDKRQLKQVLVNLFLNAVQAMAGGGVLSVSAKESQGRVTLTVDDTGPGIPQENLPHVFDPFFTTKDSGTGLGLAVVHGIIEKHGGRIKASNAPSGGARISVTLKSS